MKNLKIKNLAFLDVSMQQWLADILKNLSWVEANKF